MKRVVAIVPVLGLAIADGYFVIVAQPTVRLRDLGACGIAVRDCGRSGPSQITSAPHAALLNVRFQQIARVLGLFDTFRILVHLSLHRRRR